MNVKKLSKGRRVHIIPTIPWEIYLWLSECKFDVGVKRVKWAVYGDVYNIYTVGQNEMINILQTTFSNTSGNGLPPVGCFVITWNDYDITSWCQIESLGCKELNKFKLRSGVIVCRVCNSNVTALLSDSINHCYQFWKGNKHTCGTKRVAMYVWNHGWKWM